MRDPAIRAGLLRAGLLVAGFTAAAFGVARIPAPGAIRAAGMLALPCVLLAVLRREERRLAGAARRARERSVRPPAPAAPSRPRQ